MPNQLLQRYLNGEHREVWKDLVTLGGAVRSDRYYRDAAEVAGETMKRARHNVESIVTKLEKLGYQFTTEEPKRSLTASLGGVSMDLSSLMKMARSHVEGAFGQPGFEPRNAHEQAMARMAQGMRLMMDQTAQRAPQMNEMRTQTAERRKKNAARGALNNPDVFAPPDKKAVAELDRFEEELGGPLPISLRHWYQLVGSVNLMGFHETLNPTEGQHCPDPLVIYSFDDYDQDLSDREDGVIELILAPDALHKAHTSGGDPYAMRIPDPLADGPFLWDRPDTTFVEYLRLVFAWGGFPGWEGTDGGPRKELDFLREDLLAL
jgi:hypothetical protein